MTATMAVLNAEANIHLYERDFFAWANQQTALLRAGQFAQADIEHVAEEIESMGRSEKRELLSRLAILLMHLLKWQAQPMLRGNSWQATIKVQRREISRHLADNPSLQAKLPELLEAAYGDAILLAARESGLSEATFPPTNPWSFTTIMDAGFWPGRQDYESETPAVNAPGPKLRGAVAST